MVSPASEKVLFAKVGWMRFYEDVRPDDPAPNNGGGHNRRYVGSEILNFKEHGGEYFAYFRPKRSFVNLQRLDQSVRPRSDSLSGVTVVFVAPHPNGGVYPIGWYGQATVFSSHRERPTALHTKSLANKENNYWLSAPVSSSRRIEAEERLRWPQVRTRKPGAMGQTNHFFPRDQPQSWDWVRPILSRIPG